MHTLTEPIPRSAQVRAILLLWTWVPALPYGRVELAGGGVGAQLAQVRDVVVQGAGGDAEQRRD